MRKKLAYSVRSVTHLDTFRLERDDLVQEMRSHPRAALHVADKLHSVMPRKLAQTAVQEIYDLTGLRELLELRSLHSRWRPPRGLAKKLLKFAAENGAELEFIRKRQAQRLGRERGQRGMVGDDDRRVLDRLQANVLTLMQEQQQRSSPRRSYRESSSVPGYAPGDAPGYDARMRQSTQAGTEDDVEYLDATPHEDVDAKDGVEGQRNKVPPPLASVLATERNMNDADSVSDTTTPRYGGEQASEQRLMAWVDRRHARLEAKIDRLTRLVLAKNEGDEGDSFKEPPPPERASFRGGHGGRMSLRDNRRGSSRAVESLFAGGDPQGGDGPGAPSALTRLRRRLSTDSRKP